MKARGILVLTCQGYDAQQLVDKDGRKPEAREGTPKLQGLSSVDHKDNFPKEEGAQTRDFPRPSDVELD